RMRLIEPRGRVRLRLAAAGDIGIVGSARIRARHEGYDAPFAALAPVFAGADLGFVNLEFPIAGAGQVRPGRSAEFWHEPDLASGATAGDGARTDAPGIAPLEAAIVREDLARWGGEATVRIVSVHWGSMYVDYPPPRVLELARVLAESNVDVVLGHHPHVLQG